MTGNVETSWHEVPIERVLERLRVTPAGLSSTDARARRLECGPNALPAGRTKGPVLLIWGQLRNTLPLVLLASGLLALAFGRTVDGIVVVSVVLVNAFIGAFQEFRAGRAIKALGALVPEYVTVIRDGDPTSIPAVELAPGDVVVVEAGNRIPADMRLISVRSLRVAEAVLTGESLAVTKQVDAVAREAALGDRKCMVFSGTMVTAGTATAVVVATGSHTELGRISAMLRDVEEVETPLMQALRRFGNILTAAIGAVAYFILLTGLRRGYPPVVAVRAAVSLVVAAVPSSLPAIITVALAVAVRRMARRNAIVRTLPSVETLGCTTVVCSDKTGTLTRGEMAVRALWTGSDLYEMSGVGYVPRGQLLHNAIPVAPWPPGEMMELLLGAALCNDAVIRPKGDSWAVVGDPTEVALVVAAAKVGIDAANARSRLPRIDVVPFDPALKYMSTLHQHKTGGRLLITKGAPEVVLGRCNRMGRDGPLDGQRVTAMVRTLAERGMRVLALGSAPVPDSFASFETSPPVPLGFLGLVASMDPPRPEAIAAIRACHEAGIIIKMVTGDHPATAKAIGVEIGIAGAEDSVFSGEEIEQMPPEQLQLSARAVNVFSRVAPEHKLRLVRALQAWGDVVAMTGDGVNDAPALKQADVGVAMGLSGTAAAKEAAAVILVDDNFASIGAAVDEGRRCYDNLVKALMFVVPTNLGQSLVLLIGVVFFPVVGQIPLLPIVPLQILWVNLVTGVTLAIPLAFEVPEADLMRRPPRARDEPIFSRPLALRCLLVGTVMALGAIVLFLDEYYGEIVVPHAPPEVALRKAQTIAATTVVLFQIFYLLQCRSLRTSIFKMNPFSNPAIFIGIAATAAMQGAFVHLPAMNAVFQSAPLGLRDWLASAAMAASILPMVAMEKSLYEKRVVRRRPGRAGRPPGPDGHP